MLEQVISSFLGSKKASRILFTLKNKSTLWYYFLAWALLAILTIITFFNGKIYLISFRFFNAILLPTIYLNTFFFDGTIKNIEKISFIYNDFDNLNIVNNYLINEVNNKISDNLLTQEKECIIKSNYPGFIKLSLNFLWNLDSNQHKGLFEINLNQNSDIKINKSKTYLIVNCKGLVAKSIKFHNSNNKNLLTGQLINNKNFYINIYLLNTKINCFPIYSSKGFYCDIPFPSNIDINNLPNLFPSPDSYRDREGVGVRSLCLQNREESRGELPRDFFYEIMTTS
jgi:hypothetical protein